MDISRWIKLVVMLDPFALVSFGVALPGKAPGCLKRDNEIMK